jgi:hypothetical protein
LRVEVYVVLNRHTIEDYRKKERILKSDIIRFNSRFIALFSVLNMLGVSNIELQSVDHCPYRQSKVRVGWLKQLKEKDLYKILIY